jgi:hypothetical protein
MNYHQYRAPIGVNASYPRRIRGVSLAHFVRRMTPVQRAILVAEILEGRIVLQDLTAKSLAALVGVSPSSVHAALKCSPEERVDVLCGQRPLQSPPAPVVTVEEDGWRTNIQRFEALLDEPSIVPAN